METVSFCEIEPFCRSVLRKHWKETPIAQDIRNLNYSNGRLYEAEKVIYEGTIELICGGFPCQPFSIAGRKKGTADNRDLWPEMFRLIQQVQPAWVVGENVTHFANMAFTRTKTDLESEGYTVQPFIIPACAVGAPHRRDRLWIIAYRYGGTARKTGSSEEAGGEKTAALQAQKQERNRKTVFDCRRVALPAADVADADNQRCQGSKQQPLSRQWNKSRQSAGSYQGWRDGWPVSAPRICGVDDGIPDRIHRLKSLGNAVVPQIPEIIGKAIIQSIQE